MARGTMGAVASAVAGRQFHLSRSTRAAPAAARLPPTSWPCAELPCSRDDLARIAASPDTKPG